MTTIWFTPVNSDENDASETPFCPLDPQLITLFGKPREIGHFSIDANRKIHFNKSQMKYLTTNLKKDNLNIDLNHNFAKDIFHQYVSIMKMYQLLFWLKHKSGIPRKLDNIDFITVRGTLALVMCTPFLKGHYRSQWEICAQNINGTIYFSQIDSDQDLEEMKTSSLKHMQYQSWGYKFEQNVTTDKIDGKPDLSSRTHQLEEFCVVLENKLNCYNLIYKAEVDAVVPHRQPAPGNGNTSCYTELKTMRKITTQYQLHNFSRHKAALWWAQSYIAGIPDIICGVRNDDGIVESLQVFSVSELPEKGMGLWSPEVCLNFCNKFLTFLKKTVVEESSRVVYKFTYGNKEKIYCTRMENPSERYRIIPEWYYMDS